MEILTPDIIQTLGVSAVLAIFLYLMWQRLKDKDDRIRDMTDQLAEKYEENTRAMEKNVQAVNSLIKVNENLIQKVDDFLRGNHNKV